MSVQTVYQSWKETVQGKSVGNSECVALFVNNSNAYVEHLWPGVSWTTIVAPLAPPNDGANQLARPGAVNANYFDWIANDHNDPNQVPQQGDVMVFDHTPMAGYTNQYQNPYGHTGICDSADSNGYNLFSQQAGAPATVRFFPWKFRPCMGWYRPKVGAEVLPPEAPPRPATGHNVYLPPTTGPWHLYPEGGPYTYAAAGNHLLVPSMFGGLTYGILNDRGNGIYTIQTQDYGRGDIYTRGSDVIVT